MNPLTFLCSCFCPKVHPYESINEEPIDRVSIVAAASFEERQVKEEVAEKHEVIELNKDGLSAMHHMAMQGRLKEIKRMVSEENINQISLKGASPLHYALASKSDDKVALFLIENGADLTLKYKHWSAFDMAIDCEKFSAAKAILLKTTFEDPSALDRSGFAPIHYAASLNMKDIVASFLEQKVDIDLPAKDGSTPIIQAIMSEEGEETALYLIDQGCNLNFIYINRTPLSLARLENKEAIVKRILDLN